MKDKIIFWLGNDYTHYCLASVFQKNYDCEMYAIAEITERPKKFFQNQKLVNFEKIWFFHDQIKNKSTKANLEYLAQFEKKYKVDLWKLVQNERIFLYYNNFHKFSADEILNILEQECRFFDDILEKIKPDFFFTKISSLHHQELFYQMCKNSGVKVQVLTYSVLGQHCVITQEPAKLDQVEDLNNLEDKNRNFNDLQNYLHKFNLLKQLDSKILKPGSGFFNSIRAAKEFFVHSDSRNTKTHYTYYGRTKLKVFFYYLNDYLKTKFRESFINKNLRTEIKNSEPFVYLPLHTEIERSLLIAAPYYTNQIEAIKWIAKSLPINFKLYVKEHPAQVARAWRSISEYKQIMDIPNVVLLHPKFSNEEIYKNCSLLVTIAGTAGFEAACYGKPVITFVDLGYSLLPSVHTLKNLNEFPELIRKSLAEEIEPTSLDRYISLLEKNISKFDYADFMAKLADEFFYGNNLMDVEISETKMKSFLEKNYSMLQILADDHIKKIKWFKGK
jgi:hypothetical protein